MSTEEERGEVWRRLEERRLLPSQSRRYEIEATGERVAREALRMEGAERARSEALEARYRQLALLARRDPDDGE